MRIENLRNWLTKFSSFQNWIWFKIKKKMDRNRFYDAIGAVRQRCRTFAEHITQQRMAAWRYKALYFFCLMLLLNCVLSLIYFLTLVWKDFDPKWVVFNELMEEYFYKTEFYQILCMFFPEHFHLAIKICARFDVNFPFSFLHTILRSYFYFTLHLLLILVWAFALIECPEILPDIAKLNPKCTWFGTLEICPEDWIDEYFSENTKKNEDKSLLCLANWIKVKAFCWSITRFFLPSKVHKLHNSLLNMQV